MRPRISAYDQYTCGAEKKLCGYDERTKINMLQERQIQSSADGILLLFGEDDLSAVIAALQGGEDERRVVAAVAMGAHMADFLAWVAVGERLERPLGAYGIISRA